jgi:hypothetical protein
VSGAAQEGRVLSEALRFVAEPGQLVIPRLGDPIVTLSHLSPFLGGQSYQQALQLPSLTTWGPHEDTPSWGKITFPLRSLLDEGITRQIPTGHCGTPAPNAYSEGIVVIGPGHDANTVCTCSCPGFCLMTRQIPVTSFKSASCLEGLRVCCPESGCQTGIWCMRGEGYQGGHLCSALESNLRLTHSLPSGRRETRFRLLWICFAV